MKKILIALTVLISICGSLFVYADIPNLYRHKSIVRIKLKDYPARIDKILVEDTDLHQVASIPLEVQIRYPKRGILSCYVYDENEKLLYEDKDMILNDYFEVWDDKYNIIMGLQEEYDENKGILKQVYIHIPQDKLNATDKNKLKFKISYKKYPEETRFGVKDHLEEEFDTKIIILKKVNDKWEIFK